MADWSKGLGELPLEGRRQVLNFCMTEIPHLWKKIYLENLDDNNEDSQIEPVMWHLLLYDDQGCVESLTFKIFKEQIRFLSRQQTNLQNPGNPLPSYWRTEVSMLKLFYVLKYGYGLNALGIRINDQKDTVDLDPLQDPLLKCLYGRDLFLYQRLQCIKILSQ